jgi:hypothetical protein
VSRSAAAAARSAASAALPPLLRKTKLSLISHDATPCLTTSSSRGRLWFPCSVRVTRLVRARAASLSRCAEGPCRSHADISTFTFNRPPPRSATDVVNGTSVTPATTEVFPMSTAAEPSAEVITPRRREVARHCMNPRESGRIPWHRADNYGLFCSLCRRGNGRARAARAIPQQARSVVLSRVFVLRLGGRGARTMQTWSMKLRR